MKSITTAEGLKGKRVLLRASLNEPIRGGTILDTTKLDGALSTINLLRTAGARTILISHLSKAEGTTLQPVFRYLKEKIPLSFIGDIHSERAQDMMNGMNDGDVVLAENLRMYPEEEANDPVFARTLASLADIYVNDDFTTSHRKHASIVGVPKFLPRYMGLAFEREYSFLSQALHAPTPSLAILGGGKPETKIPLIASLANKMTDVFVCGISANVLWKSQGLEVGLSVASASPIPATESVVVAENVHLPPDVRIKDASDVVRVTSPEKVEASSAIVDAGPQTLVAIETLVKKASFILWNGPLGEYEKGYTESTHALAHLLAQSDKHVIVGGGDTLSAIAELGLMEKFTFVSTAGGAMIDFLAHGTLPGIEALEK
ncbi:MAG: phosphoglycerate kinase [Candidatus Pacebacteria bacterium]|nr:phosphoglycerate kinase [Candidatus Paceibacterota bacterium]